MSEGFIRLNRKFFKNFLWKEDRVYSKAEAWLDLISSARFEAIQELVNSNVIEVQKGELIASRRFLEKRWKWGSSKVLNFLKLLEKQEMIEIKTNHQTNHSATIIKLCNYETYNGNLIDSKPHARPNTNHGQTTVEPNTNRNKEYKEREEIQEKKEIEITCDFSFEKVWEMYERKGNKKTSERKWNSLKNHSKEKALSHIPVYVLSTPDKKFRKNFETYINQEVWMDEVIFGNRKVKCILGSNVIPVLLTEKAYYEELEMYKGTMNEPKFISFVNGD